MRPSSGLQPARRRASVCRPSGRPASARSLPPPRRSGLRFPSPVGHGRGLASRPGYAGPGEGIDSTRCCLHRFRRVGSPRPSRLRLRLRSSMPDVNAAFTPWSSGSVGLRFVQQTRPLHKCLLCGFCSSVQDFASSFLQIPPRGGHPCSWLTVGAHQPPFGTFIL